mmetsp:Transcript_26611/g.38558  ORF Transcript_26611/g.38558 Transcript_26611/m.38558 type:complete len:709 (-) Transcript_26611:1093-3219(-)
MFRCRPVGAHLNRHGRCNRSHHVTSTTRYQQAQHRNCHVYSNRNFRNSIFLQGSGCHFSTTINTNNGQGMQNSSVKDLRSSRFDDINSLPEYQAQLNLSKVLHNLSNSLSLSDALQHLSSSPVADLTPTIDNEKLSILSNISPLDSLLSYKHEMTDDEIYNTLISAICTFHLHVESRIASLLGYGYYTIGPCGEEMLSSIGCTLQNHDSVALHYRHVGVNICRQLHSYEEEIEKILLDRARSFVVSKFDPVTGGVHCAIGCGPGTSNDRKNLNRDYVVTSTLASQCPPALGRALGFNLLETLCLGQNQRLQEQEQKPISYVSIGDGSTHNSHFLSSLNLAKHAKHRNVKCPIVFGISDNGLSISYKTDGYVTKSLFPKAEKEKTPLSSNVPIYHADGNNMFDIYDKTKQAINYSRKYSSPSIIVYRDITRRFGHAATDRQSAYLSETTIQSMINCDVIASNIVHAVETKNVGTYKEWYEIFEDIGEKTRIAFEKASKEPKITEREEMLKRVSADRVVVPSLPEDILVEGKKKKKQQEEQQKTMGKISKKEKKDVMRKHMTEVLKETLNKYPNTVYLGEDVQHGGYYLVTDGLLSQFPNRIIDVPPDETTLLGISMGFSQLGFCPIVEIPYAKYLDCGVDMFYEIALNHWLTNGQSKTGMVVRLQGFDKGIFGGNFHTHNMLSHVPPGVDLVCFSNGEVSLAYNDKGCI